MNSLDQAAQQVLGEVKAELSREKARREAAEAQLHRLTSVSRSSGLCTTDLDGRVLEANDALLRLLGGTRDELRGRR